MSKLFNSVQFSKPKRNLFDLSHEKKLTMNMGDLVPIMLHEVVPGDSFRVNTESLIRFAPLVAPAMHRINAYVHYFFVPNRIIFDNWEEFITGGRDGKDTTQMPVVRMGSDTYTQAGLGSLWDYFGLPVTTVSPANVRDVNCLPFRAYQQIYDDYYRDNNLIAPVDISKSQGQQTLQEVQKLLTLRKRAYEKDYFTSALPWSQRGDEVLLPTSVNYKDPAMAYKYGTTGAEGPLTTSVGVISDNSEGVTIENIDSIDVTINDLRRSARLQEFLEKTARGGARLTEVVKAFFGVTSSDARLQRPEFLGGGKVPVVISEVLSTFNNTEVPGGNMYGHGIAQGNTNRFKRFFEEHGWIVGIMSVLPRTAYQQGTPRHFLKYDKFDLYWPTFAQLGEQPIYNEELWTDWTVGTDFSTFGYQSRYAEYKHCQSSVHGDFRGPLNYWHLGRIFETKPVLNQSFIEADVDTRIFANTEETEQKLYVQLYNDVKALRPMPYFNNPIL